MFYRFLLDAIVIFFLAGTVLAFPNMPLCLDSYILVCGTNEPCRCEPKILSSPVFNRPNHAVIDTASLKLGIKFESEHSSSAPVDVSTTLPYISLSSGEMALIVVSAIFGFAAVVVMIICCANWYLRTRMNYQGHEDENESEEISIEDSKAPYQNLGNKDSYAFYYDVNVSKKTGSTFNIQNPRTKDNFSP